VHDTWHCPSPRPSQCTTWICHGALLLARDQLYHAKSPAPRILHALTSQFSAISERRPGKSARSVVFATLRLSAPAWPAASRQAGALGAKGRRAQAAEREHKSSTELDLVSSPRGPRQGRFRNTRPGGASS